MKNQIKSRFFYNDSAVIGLSMILYMFLINGLTLLFSAAVPFLSNTVFPSLNLDLQIASRCAEIAGYVCAFLFTIIFMSKGSPGFVGLSHPAPPYAALTLPVFFVSFLLLNYFNVIIKTLFNKIGIYGVDRAQAAPRDGVPLVLFVLMFVIFPAVLEEVLFRGILLSRLRKLGDGFAVVLSSVIFALMHHDLVSMPGVFLFGLLFGYATILSNSLIPAIAMHFLNNSIAVLFLWLERHGVSGTVEILAVALLFFGITSLAGICIYAGLLAHQNKRPRKVRTVSPAIQGPGKAFAAAFSSGWMIAFIIIAVYITFALEFIPRAAEQLFAFLGVRPK